jgi:DNA-binding XRE family transcriptional regulator
MKVTAKQIRMARAGLKLSQAALADMAGINRDTLSTLEGDGRQSFASTMDVLVGLLVSQGVEFGEDGWVRINGDIIDEQEEA